jgi:hypothetical protein
MDDLQQILNSLDEIESTLNKHDCPEPNPQALSQVRLLCSRITGFDSYISEKASRISALAGVFYSDRKHTVHPRGASALLAEISYDLPNRIRAQIAHLRRIEKERAEPSDGP